MRVLRQKILFSTISIAILAVLVFYLAGCAGKSSEVVSVEPSLSNAASSVEVASVETAAPTIEPTLETAVITETVEIDHCLDCHTNKDMLIDTADPEEEVISENEGEG